MIEFLMINWVLLMIIIFMLTSSSGICYHVTRKDRIITATRIHEQFDPERQQRIRLGLERIIIVGGGFR